MALAYAETGPRDKVVGVSALDGDDRGCGAAGSGDVRASSSLEISVAGNQARELLRSFFGPLLTPGPRRIAADEGLVVRDVIRDKQAILGLRLPGRMLFLFRLRFGLYAVLSRLQAEVDWAGHEIQWARAA